MDFQLHKPVSDIYESMVKLNEKNNKKNDESEDEEKKK